MKNSTLGVVLEQFGSFLHRYRTPFLFWLYIMAMMAYAYRWMPE